MESRGPQAKPWWADGHSGHSITRHMASFHLPCPLGHGCSRLPGVPKVTWLIIERLARHYPVEKGHTVTTWGYLVAMPLPSSGACEEEAGIVAPAWHQVDSMEPLLGGSSNCFLGPNEGSATLAMG